MKRIIPFDDYNCRFHPGSDFVGTVLPTWGNFALTNGWKLIEMIAYDGYNGNFVGDEVIGTVVPQNSRWGMTNGYKIFENDMAKIYRIRKLTSRECFRLMGVSDEDVDKIKASGISESQQYKMAGNSIVVQVLEGIFTQMFRKDSDCLF